MKDETQLQLFDRNNSPQHPGVILHDLLKRRGLNQNDLVTLIGIDRPATISAIIKGNHRITTKMALKFAEVLGTEPDYWIKLQAAYDLFQEMQLFSPEQIKERLKIFDMAPIKEMEKRGWIESKKTLPQIEQELCSFFEISNLDEVPALIVNARVSNSALGFSRSQKAWCYRALKMARTLKAKRYIQKNIPSLIRELRNLSYLSKSTEDISSLLAEYGIRFVVVEPISKCKIDGAAFWLNEKTPVIAISLRLDRVDNFWFVLMHELSHIVNKDSVRLDSDVYNLSDREMDEIEKRANSEASSHLVSPEDIESFILRVSPLYSKRKIIQFANRLRVHPGIIVGQLQHRGELSYSQGRAMLVKVRKYVIHRALTDGWGSQVPKL